MKKSVFIVAVLAISLVACAQNPPKSVADNFKMKFQDASRVKWDQEEENEWEAEFKMDGNEMSASFDNAGKWLETEVEIKKTDLPEKVKNAVSEKYTDYKIDEVSKIETSDFKGFEIAIEKGK